jgi:site-specific recombinase XerD
VSTKGRRFPPEVLTEAEVRALMSGCSKRAPTGVRNRGVGGRQTAFCTLSGGPVAARYVRNRLRRLARKAGIERRVNPHAFRHTLAAELVPEGVNVVQIQHVLGHASLDGTAHYLRRIAPAELVDLMSQRG